ncbi:MAG: FlgD immunoglobulin-like domain containing protein, partial [bacterium]
YTFTDPTEGIKRLYGWIRNPAGVVSSVDSTSIILDMTPPHFVVDPVAFDTTGTSRFPTTFRARANWANERSIKAIFGELSDELSPVDSMEIFGEIEGDTVKMAYIPGDTVPLFLLGDSTRSLRVLSFRGRDRAQNWGDERHASTISRVNFRLDLIPPRIRFAMGSSGQDSIAQVRPQYLMIEFDDGPEYGYPAAAYIWVSGFNETLYVESDSTWIAETNPRIVPVRFDLAESLDVNTLYNINALMVDSAGNPSNIASLKLWVIPDTINLKLTLYDATDTTDSEFTNNQTVKAKITTRIPAEYMMISESRTFADANWVPFSPVFDFTFSDMRNERKWVYCKIMQSGFVSVVDSASIIIDTIPPVFSGIQAKGEETNDPNWSNTYAVKVEAINPNDEPPGVLAGLLIAEDSTFTVNRQFLPFTGVDYTIRYVFTEQRETGEYGLGNRRAIYAKVLDRAENESSTKTYTIIVDVEKVEIITNFPNPFDPTREVTYIRVKAPKGSEEIKMKIFDQFGSLVWSKELKANKKLMDIEWDGRNDKGKIVANGAYICIVE